MSFKKLFSVLIFCTTTVFFISAQDTSYRYPLDHPIYAELRDLLRLAGRPLFSWTPPLERHEIENLLSSIDIDSLDEDVFSLWVYIKEEISKNSPYGDALVHSGPFTFDIVPELSFELRGKSDADQPWRKKAKNESPLLSLPMHFAWGPSIYGALDIDVKNSPAAYLDGEGFFDTNIPWPVTDVDLSVPYRAFIGSAGPWWSVFLGRDLLDIGQGHSGNLSISSYPDCYDYFSFSLFSSSFRYSLFVSQLPLSLKNSPKDFLPFGDGVDRDGYALQDGSLLTSQRHLYYSRIDFRLGKRVALSIGQGNLVGNSPLELRYLNPFIVYHSLWSWRDYPGKYEEKSLVGSLFSFDIDIALPLGFGLYSQFTLNEFTTTTERTIYGNDTTPDSMGLLAGLDWAGFLAGGRLSCAFEAVWGSPFLYLLTSPWASFIWMNRHSALYNTDRQSAWIGHPYARDSLFFTLIGHYEIGQQTWQVKGSYQAKGAHADLVYDYKKSEANAALSAPSSPLSHLFAFEISAKWRIFPVLSLGLSAEYFGSFNPSRGGGFDFSQGLELITSITYSPLKHRMR